MALIKSQRSELWQIFSPFVIGVAVVAVLMLAALYVVPAPQ